MIAFDGMALGMGLAIGTAVSAVFFAGLGFGMRAALRAPNPVAALVLSAVLRMAGLLAIGWLVAVQGGAWAFAGYGAAFLAVRFVATAVARSGIRRGDAQDGAAV